MEPNMGPDYFLDLAAPQGIKTFPGGAMDGLTVAL